MGRLTVAPPRVPEYSRYFITLLIRFQFIDIVYSTRLRLNILRHIDASIREIKR